MRKLTLFFLLFPLWTFSQVKYTELLEFCANQTSFETAVNFIKTDSLSFSSCYFDQNNCSCDINFKDTSIAFSSDIKLTIDSTIIRKNESFNYLIEVIIECYDKEIAAKHYSETINFIRQRRSYSGEEYKRDTVNLHPGKGTKFKIQNQVYFDIALLDIGVIAISCYHKEKL
jgi:hypothetical protein